MSTVTLQTDLGTLAGGVSTFTVASTNSLGQATVSLNSAVVGLATVSALGSGGQFANTAGDPVRAPAPVNAATTLVEFTSGPATQSIIIAGERQNRSIIVDGLTQGLAEGTIVLRGSSSRVRRPTPRALLSVRWRSWMS